MPTITLIHPSRGRAQKAKDTYHHWMSKASGKIQIQHILSLDYSDPSINDYIALQVSSGMMVNENTCVVEATNHGAKKATGDILIYLSDDFKCPDNWDELILDAFGDKLLTEPALVKVDDCLQGFDICVLTIPIMNRKLYEKLGYFWYPGYKSMFVDEDLFWTTKNNNWMILAPELKFPHEHVCNGKAENDETYQRSAANWDQGKALFAQRSAEGFPV